MVPSGKNREEFITSIIGIERLWNHSIGSDNQLIAILDTGEPNHKHFPIEWRNRFVKSDNFRKNTQFSSEDNEGHGTGVAAIATMWPLFNGVIGINHKAKIQSVKVHDSRIGYSVERWANAINCVCDSAYQWKSIVIILCAGTWFSSKALEEAIYRADSMGIPIVTIAHNDGISQSRYPGFLSNKYDGLFCVGAVNSEGQLLRDYKTGRGSNFGNGVSFYLNGEEVPTVDCYGNHFLVNGTSAAGAILGGIISIVQSINLKLDLCNMKKIILASTVKSNDGYKILNIKKLAYILSGI